jgi:hypothetical protein
VARDTQAREKIRTADRHSTIDGKAHDLHLPNLQPLLPIAKLIRARSHRIPMNINSLVRGEPRPRGEAATGAFAIAASPGSAFK